VVELSAVEAPVMAAAAHRSAVDNASFNAWRRRASVDAMPASVPTDRATSSAAVADSGLCACGSDTSMIRVSATPIRAKTASYALLHDSTPIVSRTVFGASSTTNAVAGASIVMSCSTPDMSTPSSIRTRSRRTCTRIERVGSLSSTRRRSASISDRIGTASGLRVATHSVKGRGAAMAERDTNFYGRAP
jgi:hypothetical protein